MLFCFDSEFHWKINVIDDLEEDTMEFDYMKKYVFRPDLSNNLTGEEVITTLHPGLFKEKKSIHQQKSIMLKNLRATRPIKNALLTVFLLRCTDLMKYFTAILLIDLLFTVHSFG